MVIGYMKAKSLMVQLDGKMAVTMEGETLIRIKLYHPNQQDTYVVRKDSGKRLMAECRVCGRKTDTTAILCYDHDGANEDLI